MANLSQEKREKMLNFLNKIRAEHQDDETRLAINEIENALTEKKYGLVWEEHTERVDEEIVHNIPIFTEAEDRKIKSVDNNDYNFLIEGDNLHSLKLLEKTHRGKIDVIYIDPPYNTGLGFIYDDSYIDKNDGYAHSKWLSFMSKRLEIARNILAKTGFIMISINDNELCQLKILCNEIFGENNFLSMMIWQSTPGSNTGLDIKTVTEYVLVYAKSKKDCLIASKPITDTEKYKESDEYEKIRGKYQLNKLDRRMTGSHYSEALNYPITTPDGTLVYPGGTTEPTNDNWNWRWGKSKLEWGIENGFIVFKKNKSKWAIYFKQYLNVDNNNNPIERQLPYQNLIKDEDGINSARGTKEIMDIFKSKVFDYPKPLNLLKYLIKISPIKDLKLLDFFAGSGTTGHAVVQLNKEDGGNRKYILCTNNENNICEEVTYQRLKKIQEELPHNLKYLRTEFIPKFDENEETSIKNKMLDHIKELIELEYMCEIDGINNILIKDEEEFDEIINENLKENIRLFISSDIFASKEQQSIIDSKNIELIEIPEYYYKNELREVGEL